MNNFDSSKIQEEESEEKTLGQSTLERCNQLINQYLDWKMKNMRRSNLFQGAALVFTAAIPVVLQLPWEHVNIVGAGLSSLAAISTGLLSVNGWRENFIRYGYIYHMLQVEKYLYLAQATREYPEKDPKKAAKNFAKRIEGLVMLDVTEWRTEMQRIEERSELSEEQDE